MKRTGIMIMLLAAALALAGCAERPPKEVDCVISISQGHTRIIRNWQGE